MTMRGAIRELIALGPQEVQVRLPEGAEVQGVQLLKAGHAVDDYEIAGDGTLSLMVPEVWDHEVVVIDLTPGPGPSST
jgi:hypothetical protein